MFAARTGQLYFYLLQPTGPQDPELPGGLEVDGGMSNTGLGASLTVNCPLRSPRATL